VGGTGHPAPRLLVFTFQPAQPRRQGAEARAWSAIGDQRRDQCARRCGIAVFQRHIDQHQLALAMFRLQRR